MSNVTKLFDEFNDPEQSYRRGYAQGAWDVLDAVKERLTEDDRSILEEWFQEQVWEWRSAGMRKKSVRATEINPFPPGVRPPREGLEALKDPSN
jgi:hypothetical protein